MAKFPTLALAGQPRLRVRVIEPTAPPMRLESFEAFYKREYSSVLGLAYVMSGDRWLAEELTQEAMIEAHRRWDRIVGYDEPGAWVRRVLSNKRISKWRRSSSEVRAMNRIQSQRHEQAQPAPELDGIFALVRQLPTRQAHVVALRYWDDMSVKEIAGVLELSPETVKTHLKRGMAKLEQLLAAQNQRPNLSAVNDSGGAK